MKLTKINYDKDRAEKLTERLLANPRSPQRGLWMNDLLSEFHRGYPIENLRLLLRHDNQDFVTIGAWIASELGEKGRPLLGDIYSLLGHPEKRIRFSAIDCILVWAEPSNKAELASVVKLVDDPESGVRWKAMDFLARAAREQLEAALSYLEVMEPKSPHVRGLQWLLGTDASNPHEITTILQNQDKLLRKYGVVAARQISKEDREPLLYAASLDDPDVKGFADSSITLL